MNSPLIIPLIDLKVFTGSIPEGAACIDISAHNWAAQFPYKPDAKAFLWHNGKELFISYEVDEDHVAALAREDNGEVWNDSCVEFFISFGDDGYYNIEASCIGRILISHRRGRSIGVEFAGDDILAGVERFPSLGEKPFELRRQEGSWHLTLKLPASTFFRHRFEGFGGLTARCNMYKCGDKLPRPHFLSWQPVRTENPDFHCPEFFSEIIFGK